MRAPALVASYLCVLCMLPRPSHSLLFSDSKVDGIGTVSIVMLLGASQAREKSVSYGEWTSNIASL